MFADSVVDSWLLMSSPYQLMGLIALYLTIVFKIGPKLMEDRQAFNLTNETRMYNLLQIVVCFSFVVGSLSDRGRHIWSLGWKCDPEHPSEMMSQDIETLKLEIFRYSWMFMFLRISEFFETIVFILRKKQSQVTFLHCYHHIVVVLSIWQYLKYSDHERGFFIGLTNAAIHIVM